MIASSTIRTITIRAILAISLAWSSMSAGQTISSEATEHWNAARTAETQKQFDTAVTEYGKVTELEPTFATGFVSLGQALMEKHDYAAALVPLKHALELDSGLAPAHQLLGYALLAQGYAAEAIPHLERVHEQAALGIAQSETGHFDEAIPNLQAALQKNPNDPDLLYYLGRASGLLSKQSVDTLLAVSPDTARAHQAIAENYFVLRQMPEAEREYEEALKLRPDTPNLHLELGQVFAMTSRWPEAEEQFRAETKAAAGKRRSSLSSGRRSVARREIARSPRHIAAFGQAPTADAGNPVLARQSCSTRVGCTGRGEIMARTPLNRETRRTCGTNSFCACWTLSQAGQNRGGRPGNEGSSRD